jgi:hypothetical protein
MPSTQTQLNMVQRLAVGVVHLLAGNADLEFPTSTQAHPSFEVIVTLTPKGPVWPGAGVWFPFRVRWDIWDEAVVPILQNDSYQFYPDNGAERNWAMLAKLEDVPGLTAFYQKLLVDSLKTTGYLPADVDLNPVVVPAAPAAPGEPVVRNPEAAQAQAEVEAAGGTVYEQLDVSDVPPVYQKFDQ